MLTLPHAFFVTRFVRLTTFLVTPVVFAIVAAVFVARRAGFVAPSFTLVTAKQGTVALCFTWLMDSTTPTTTAVTGTRVSTL